MGTKGNLLQLLAGIAISGTVICLAGCSNNKSRDALELASAKASELPTIAVEPAVSKFLHREIDLPGELTAYNEAGILPKVEGFVQDMRVDRGSMVRKGELLCRITAPELEAQVREAEAKVAGAHGVLLESKSKLDAARASVREAQAKQQATEATYARLKKAAEKPGVISDNELDVSKQGCLADAEHVHSLQNAVQAAQSMVIAAGDNFKAAQQNLESLQATRQYLTVTSPYDGMITERNVNQGDLVHPNDSKPMLVLQELKHLRLTVAVPEIAVAGVKLGQKLDFTVPAFPDEKFSGKIARIGHALDEKTRSMPVELDVWNDSGKLEPGMFPDVKWIVERPYETVFVPESAVGQSMEKIYVIRVREGVADQIKVARGQAMGDLCEVFGDVRAGDEIAIRAMEDLKSGTKVATKEATQQDVDALHKNGGGE